MMQAMANNSGLPSGCKQIAYLQSSETQYIDTEHICQANESIQLDFEILTPTKVTNIVAFGWRNQGTYKDTYQCYINASNSSNIMLYYGISASTSNPIIGKIGERINLHIDPNKQEIHVNGNLWSGNRGWADQYGGKYPACLFTFNMLGTPNKSVIGNVRIYEYAVKDVSDNYVQHFIPIVKKNGVACMYDMANKKFYYNKGTGEFIKGQNIKL